MAKQAQTVANPPVTMTQEALKALLAQVRAEALAERDAASKADTTADMDKACTKAFIRAGYKAEDIQPRINVQTYNRWLAAGRRVRPGETAVKVKNLRLFHISQTEALSKAEAKAAIADLEAKKAARTADRLPKPSPVETPKVSPAPTAPRKNAKVLITEAGNA